MKKELRSNFWWFNFDPYPGDLLQQYMSIKPIATSGILFLSGLTYAGHLWP